MPKTAKKTTRRATKKQPVAKKRTLKPLLTKTTNQQSKDKLSFFLGLLIIITGASIMLEVLSLSFKVDSSNYFKDLFLFPIAMVFLLLGIGIVVNRSFYSRN